MIDAEKPSILRQNPNCENDPCYSTPAYIGANKSQAIACSSREREGKKLLGIGVSKTGASGSACIQTELWCIEELGKNGLFVVDPKDGGRALAVIVTPPAHLAADQAKFPPDADFFFKRRVATAFRGFAIWLSAYLIGSSSISLGSSTASGGGGEGSGVRDRLWRPAFRGRSQIRRSIHPGT